MTTVDELLGMKVETLLLAFFNARESDSGSFEVTSKWGKQLNYDADRAYVEAAIQLSEKYEIAFEQSGKTLLVSTISNPKSISFTEFRERLYLAIAGALADLPAEFDLDVEMALALFLLRGSPDTKFGYYAVDIKNLDPMYAENIQKLLISTDQLLSRLNLNFRDLQPQFVAGTHKRNTQIRANLKWFYDVVLKENGHLNPYKKAVLDKNVQSLGETRLFHSFEDRLIFFQEKIVGKDYSNAEREELRRELKFLTQSYGLETESEFVARNQKIISYARETFADVCVGCSDSYPIESRSFLMQRNNRYYFEVNHVIAYSSDSKAVDVLDNLVKLCATCHRALTPRRAHEELQKQIISKMLDSRPEVSTFVNSRNLEPGVSTVDFVFKNLK
jgi:5-methylcytosine-specific restriction protein A